MSAPNLPSLDSTGWKLHLPCFSCTQRNGHRDKMNNGLDSYTLQWMLNSIKGFCGIKLIDIWEQISYKQTESKNENIFTYVYIVYHYKYRYSLREIVVFVSKSIPN